MENKIHVWNHQPVFRILDISAQSWLGGGLNLPLWKIMEWKSVGMMTFPTEWKIMKFHGSSHHQRAGSHSYVIPEMENPTADLTSMAPP